MVVNGSVTVPIHVLCGVSGCEEVVTFPLRFCKHHNDGCPFAECTRNRVKGTRYCTEHNELVRIAFSKD